MRAGRWVRNPGGLAETALYANLAFNVLAWGGAVPWALAPLGALSFAGLFLAIWDVSRRGRRLWLPAATLLFLGVALLCLVQLVPLPGPLLARLAPPMAEARDFALVPLGLTRLRPLSADPSATWRELAKHLSYLAVFLTAANVASSSQAARRLLSSVALTGGLLVAVGLFHLLLNEKALFGVFPFAHADPPLVTPLGNPNHLAAFLTLSATVALGLGLTSPSRQRMVLFGLTYVVSGAGVLLSLSRGGIAFFLGGQVVLLGAVLALRRRDQASERSAGASWLRPLLAAGLLALMAGAGAYVAYEPVMVELHTADSLEKIKGSKVELWPSIARAARAAWPLGFGRGAFEAVYPRYQEKAPDQTFTHAENVVLELAVELGFPSTVLLVGFAFALLGQRLLRPLRVVEAAAAVALGALALHELFDFACELSGAAVATSLVLATLWPRPASHDEGKGGWKSSTRPLWPLAGVLAGVLVLALVRAKDSAAVAEARLGALVSQAPAPQVRALGVRLMDAHPFDYSLYAAVGGVEARSRDAQTVRDGLAFLNRAFFFKPIDPALHFETAEALRRLVSSAGARQALLEYRMAVEQGANAQLTWRRALPLVQSEDDLRLLWGEREGDAWPLAQELLSRAPPPKQQEHLPEAKVGVRPDGTALARALLGWAEAEASPKVARTLWLGQARLELNAQQWTAADEAVDRAERLMAPPGQVAPLRAEALNAQGKRTEAVAVLEAAAKKAPEDVSLGYALVSQYLANGRPVTAREALWRLRPYLTDRVSFYATEAETYKGEGKLNLALASYQSAVRLAPERAGLHYAVASVYESLHRLKDAEAEVRAGLSAEGPTGKARAEAWLQRLDAQSVESGASP
jgi:tetratricopeptide (TPR) repeat protein